MSTQGTPAPIRFRCSQCEKVLKVSRSKAGQVVTCPACATELIVPNAPPDAPTIPAAVADPPAPEASPFGFLNLNLDAGPAHAPSPAANPAPPPAEAGPAFPSIQFEPSAPTARPVAAAAKAPPPAPAPVPEPFFPGIRTEAAPAPAPAAKAPPPVSGAVAEPFFPGLRTEPAAAAEVPAAVTPAFPLIQAAPEPIRPEPAAARSAPVAVSSRDTPRRNDVVLPRTAVVLWTFMVLVAVIFAFTAGVLLGHFVWLRPPAP